MIIKVWLLVSADTDHFDILDAFSTPEAAEQERKRKAEAGEDTLWRMDVMELTVREA